MSKTGDIYKKHKLNINRIIFALLGMFVLGPLLAALSK